MDAQLTVTSERVDDIPVLVAGQVQMGLPELLDAHFPTHGNRQGLSLGWLVPLWLAHVLSEADHRLSHVRTWAQQRLETLQQCSGQAVSELDFTDDRLADVLTYLGDDELWPAFERALDSHLLRVYDLRPRQVRLDATSASGYWSVREDGLFQLGYSTDHRPDLPQVKVMLASLDPLALPVATQVVGGQRADDPLYIPAIEQVRQGLGQRGLLYVGDCKMGALATRAYLQAGEDYYLCPLRESQLPLAERAGYLQAVGEDQQVLVAVYCPRADGSQELLAEGFEVSAAMQTLVGAQMVSWQERRLVTRSVSLVQRAEQELEQRLAKAQAALGCLLERKRGKHPLTTLEELQTAVEAVVVRYEVQGLLSVQCEVLTSERRVAAYGGRPAEVRAEQALLLTVSVNLAAVVRAKRLLGWRVHATNQPAAELSLAQALLAYRDEYLIEHDFARLKGKPLSLAPTYLHDEQRVKGLIRLLSLGLRLFTLLEFVVRRSLAQDQSKLCGLSVAHPHLATARPTAERLLEAFKGITLSKVQLGMQSHTHLTPLSELQQRILTLLHLPVDLYSRLATQSLNLP